MPHTAAGKRPTGVSSENLPPTPLGIKKVLKPSCFAIFIRLPFSASVVAIIWSWYLSPSFVFNMSWMIKNWDMVSEVLPDFVITLKAVFSISITSKRASILSGSTLSTT